MKEQLISFETAKFAKQKGFDCDCNNIHVENSEATYIQDAGKPYPMGSKTYDAPTQSLLQKWLRDEKEVIIEIRYSYSKSKWYYDLSVMVTANKYFKTYEEALEEGLQGALKLIEL